MSLIPGSRIGVYEVLDALGRGGMGEVYRARDTKLDREVALKILPESFGSDPDRLMRFEREAKTLASLNHPHIAQIHGFEQSGGTSALVMELIEGEDLAQRIAHGPIPIDEALPIARQIAEALEAAHEQGIIHRDLKPANIKVRTDGTVKVLDFGLAKALDPATGNRQPAAGLENSPTITSPAMTQAGMILGTAAYMSPEQAKGKPVDRRADIWAFGCVLFEMLTGRRAFAGDDLTDTIVSVMSREPDWSALPSDTPAPVRRLLFRCLMRDVKARVRDIGEARQQIDSVLNGGGEIPGVTASESATPGTLPRATSRVLPWAIAGVAVTALLAVLAIVAPWRMEPTVSRPLLRLDVDLGDNVSLPAVTSGSAPRGIAISPDGARLAYVSGTPTKVFIRRLDQPTATELAGTDGAADVFFSPDGQWLGFAADRKLSKVSVEGGAVVPLAEITSNRGAAWTDSDSIFLGVYPNLVRIPSGGGTPETIGEIRPGELSLGSPDALPGGKAILLAVDSPGRVDRTNIDIVTLADRSRRTLVRGGATPRYVATSTRGGHLLYVSGATLFAAPFDLDALDIVGSAVPILNDVAAEVTVGSGRFDISRNGTLIYLKARREVQVPTTVQWLGPDGRATEWPARPGLYGQLRLSPNGKHLALTVADRTGTNLWLYDSGRDVLSPLTSGSLGAFGPLWSRDGQYVVFASLANGILQARADGSTPPQVLVPSKANQFPTSFSPDGKRLAFSESAGGGQIWTVSIDDDGRRLSAGTPEPFLTDVFAYRTPSFSPDGRWLAYQSRESGGDEVFVRAFPSSSSGGGGRWQISSGGGAAPRWLPAGDALLYQSGDQIVAVPYSANGDTFVAGKPRPWMAGLKLPNGVGGIQWDLSPDGKRVVVLKAVQSPGDSKPEHVVVFVQNFFDELQRRAPLPR